MRQEIAQQLTNCAGKRQALMESLDEASRHIASSCGQGNRKPGETHAE